MAPDYCCGCGEIGSVLCPNCFYDITCEFETRCLDCWSPKSDQTSCSRCKQPYQNAWTIGIREGTLERLVGTSKFESVRSGCDVQAQLLHSRLPQLPAQTCIVPVPTIRRHIRQRGYGHAERIAQQLANLRKTDYDTLVSRKQQFVQHGATKKQREQQAKLSYTVQVQLDPDCTYVVVDDVYTTGSTVRYVTQALQAAGAVNVWIAVTSRQTLD